MEVLHISKQSWMSKEKIMKNQWRSILTNNVRNRDNPVGYKLFAVEFANGEPVEPADSADAAINILTNADNSDCPSACFRPVGLAWDEQGRLYMSSDATGELYVITRADGTPASGDLPSQASSTQASSAARLASNFVSKMRAHPRPKALAGRDVAE
jgi:hypothetical protein